MQDAELASLREDPDAFKLYDIAVKYACFISHIEFANATQAGSQSRLGYGRGLGSVSGRLPFPSLWSRVRHPHGYCLLESQVVFRGLGSELQARGIARHRQWGAYGIVVSRQYQFTSPAEHIQNHLSRSLISNVTPLKRNIFSAETGGEAFG